MKQAIKLILITLFISILISCSDPKLVNYNYQVVYDNGDKDTLTYNGYYIREYLDKGDLKVINEDLEHKTIASSVRTYMRIKIDNGSK